MGAYLNKKDKIFVLRSPQVIEHLGEYLKSQPLDPTLEVVIRPHKVARGVSQHRLYFLWATVLAGEQGLTKEEIHEDLKKRILVPIYERDNPDYGAMIQAVRTLHKSGGKEEAAVLAREIVRLTSTTNATVDQFTEYLNEIEKDSANRGIFLPRPEDRYELALRGKDK